MKIGPITISRNGHDLALPQRTGGSRPPAGELGATGTTVFGGILTHQDYNTDLQAPTAYDVFDRMRMSDGQVRAATAVVKLPLLRAEWTFQPASDSAQDREIAEFCEENLLRGMSRPFKHTMREILLHLDYGSYPFEKVWEVRDDGLVHLRKLAPRHPRTVLQWLVDDTGGLSGIKQGASSMSGWRYIDIPVDKLLVFVNELEGSNYRGISMLRAAYKHWYFKSGLEKVDAIAKEKRGVGVDVGTIKAGATDKASLKETLERALMTFHGHEKNYFVEDEENFTYRMDTGSARGGLADALPSIEYHDLRILRSILAEFLAMGEGSTGSLAMHRDKSTFFLMALEAIGDNVAETFNTYLIPQWVRYNWQVDEYPRLVYSRLDTRDTKALADAVTSLMGVGALTPTRETEEELRVINELPPLPENDEAETLPIAASRRVNLQVVNQRDRYERRTEARIAAYFRRWVKRIDIPALVKDVRRRRGVEMAENPDARDYLAAVLAAWPKDDDLEEIVYDAYLMTANGAGRNALQELGISGRFDLRGERVLRELRNRAAEMVKGIDEVSQERVRRILAAGIDRGAHPDEIARDIRNEFSEWSVSRSQAIARTETNRAWSKTTQDAFERNGIEARQWVSIQEDPDEQCSVNERAGPVPVGTAFPSGDMFPPAHTLCRCAITAANIAGWEPPDAPWRGEGE